ncbi:alanine aminotransferase [Candidatus Micrarchaeota archaeon CG_4_10_14_0_2_um_filter_55_9]|nr:MAG: hypothetical protein AUJ15_04125 [Candidatus Micrarchaeota archaeon CG1_02_55_41]PIO02963.1 MAG: alanine aminotransferase [Candidatus Micrarchaeota archaeon CG09_land_8_20_14_0_10_55_25]PIZ92018.1 MAG: alanine aminotransferase [Candidatus Micrarchaeota archaeon CG_4_10_14_0_2_um_filter_55_9]PJD01316.1 MAG: alanine aminotransferase [Candidatus Micrarchaeota archaeon CG10_big_fil_rev_8_21_14_0_10_54_18]
MAAKRLNGVTYAIRDVLEEARKVEATGKKLLKLNIGDPNAYDHDTPEHIKNALVEAINSRKNGYSDSQGVKELREAVCRKNKAKGVDCAPEDVLVSSGLSEAVNYLLAAMVEPGDNVLLPSPCYPLYKAFTIFYGGKPRFYAADAEWNPDAEDLRNKIDENTKAIVLINPNNPTGALYEEKTVREIAGIAAEHGVPILSDEIYDEIVFEGKHVSTASLTDSPVITMNGLSKNYVAPGWRVGWATFTNFDDELKNAVLKLARLRLCSPTPMQYAAATALQRGFQKEFLDVLRPRRDLTFKRLNELPGVSCVKPGGAFYAFPSVEGPWETDKKFVLELLRETGVLTVFGSGFDAPGKHFRTVFLPDEATLNQAFEAMQSFLEKRV